MNQGQDHGTAEQTPAAPLHDGPAGEGGYITLTKAAQLAPGRPSTNCLWRWCRRGVLARTGERIRLRHVRVGGKIFTTELWLAEFGRQLAEADRAYFDGKFDEASQLPQRDPRYAPPSRRQGTSKAQASRQQKEASIDRELDAEGL
jgi:hypothetical protein